MRGRTDRIALIHAVYAAAWAGLAAEGGAPVALAAVTLVVAAGLVLLGWRGLGRSAPALPGDDTGRRIARINLVTALAAAGTFVVAHRAGRDDLLVAGVLAVMGLHFVPLWRVLRRVSLFWMGLALLGCAVVAAAARAPSAAALLAALVFAANSARLLLAARG